MAFTLDAGFPQHSDQTNGNSDPSISLTTPGTNRLVIAVVSLLDGTQWAPTTVSGGGLTWVKWAGAAWDSGSGFAQFGGVEVWAALAPTALTSQTITAVRNATAGSTGASHIALYVGTGHKDTGTLVNNKGAVGTAFAGASTHSNDVALTGTIASSTVIGIVLQGDTGLALTANANTTWDFTVTDASGNDGWMASGRYTGTLGGTVTFGSSTATKFWTVAAAEVLTASVPPIQRSGKAPKAGPQIIPPFLRVPLLIAAIQPAAPAVVDEDRANQWPAPAAWQAPPQPLVGGLDEGPLADPKFPLSIHASGRYLVDAQSNPFPILGDSPWGVIISGTVAQQNQYLDDRVSRGFNTALFWPFDHKYGPGSVAAADVDGNLAFTKRLDAGSWTAVPSGTVTASGNAGGITASPYGSNPNDAAHAAPDFTTPNETFWQRADRFIDNCANRGIQAVFFNSYYGFNNNDEGWSAELVANDAVTGWGNFGSQTWSDNTKSQVWNLAAWMANRWKARKNIIWVLGADCGVPTGNTLSSGGSTALLHFYQGATSVAGQQSTLWTGHWGRGSSGGAGTLATDISGDATNGTALAAAMAVEAFYAALASAQTARAAYSHSPTLPAFLIESYYENNGTGGTPNRRFLWWSAIGGIGGYIRGDETEWPFVNGTWQGQLNSTGSQNAAILNAFWTSIPWQTLVPDGLGSIGTLITAGGGTASPQSTDYVAAAANPTGTLLIAYLPPAHTGSVTVDLTKLSGTIRARWFDPTNGSYSAIGTFANVGTQAFTTTGNNAAGGADWVLQLDLGAAVDEDAVVQALPPPPQLRPLPAVIGGLDEVVPAGAVTIVDDVGAGATWIPPALDPWPPPVTPDESWFPSAVDEDAQPVQPPPPVRITPPAAAAPFDESWFASIAEEDAQPLAPPPALRSYPAAAAAFDESWLASAVDDEAPWPIPPPPSIWPYQLTPASDDLPITASVQAVDDEVAAPLAPPPARYWPPAPAAAFDESWFASVAEEDAQPLQPPPPVRVVPPAPAAAFDESWFAAVIDEDAQPFPVPARPLWWFWPGGADDELPIAPSLTAIDDEVPPPLAPPPPKVWPAAPAAAFDESWFASAVDEDAQPFPVPAEPLRWFWPGGADDELPIAPSLTAVDDEITAPLAPPPPRTWPAAPASAFDETWLASAVEEGSSSWPAPAGMFLAWPQSFAEELPVTAAPSVVDEVGSSWPAPGRAPAAWPQTAADDLPVIPAAPIVDSDLAGSWTPPAWRGEPIWPVAVEEWVQFVAPVPPPPASASIDVTQSTATTIDVVEGLATVVAVSEGTV